MSENNKNTLNVYTPILVLLLVAATFFVGRLSAQVEGLKSGTTAGTPTAQPTNGAVAPTGSKIDIAGLKGMAKQIKLNQGDFDKCLDEGKYAERVGKESKEGQDLGVSGTPSFFINGVLIVGAQPQSEFEKIIDAELKDGSGDKVASTSDKPIERKKLAYGTGPVKGANNAKIKIVEYTDFECPFCNRAFPTIEAVMKKYEGKISLEYKSYPLPFHSSAQKAAEAALCSNDQKKFWEMHDLIFTEMAK